jgi:putative aldouronate transport system substrate-binding protein
MRKRTGLAMLAILVTAAMILAACTSTPQPTQPAATQAQSAAVSASTEPQQSSASPLGKYDPPITLTTIRGIEPSRTYIAGETWDNNLWTKAFEERLGIKFDYLWTCPSSEYEQKVNVAIASDDIPEFWTIRYDQFYRLAAAGKLADIGDAFENYAGVSLRHTMKDVANGEGLKMDMYQGKLYGLGDAPGYALGGNMLWYRDDWAKNVGVEAPKTWDDVLNMMYKFTTGDPNKNGAPTVGMGLSKSLWDTGDDLGGFFAAYGAYPTIWVDNGGKLEFGAVQAQCKDALLKLQQLYKDGVIDNEFTIKGDWDNYADDMIKDKVGLEFGPVWLGDWTPGDIMKNHPNEATWTCMEIPAANGSVAKRAVSGKQLNVSCMRADTKYPEAVVKLINLGNALMTDEGTAEGKYHNVQDAQGNNIDTFFCYNDFVGIGGDPDWNYVCAVKVTEALANKDASALNDEQKSYYDRSVAYLDGTDMTGYRSYKTFGPNGAMQAFYNSFQAGNVMINQYYGPNTDTMNAKLGNLNSKRDEVFVKIIMGDPIEKFDEWVSYFNAQGGAEITQEVNDWYASK